MKALFGLPFFVLWLVFAFIAFRYASAGWSNDHPDLGLWWAIIASLLAIAAVGALIGGYLHNRYHRR